MKRFLHIVYPSTLLSWTIIWLIVIIGYSFSLNTIKWEYIIYFLQLTLDLIIGVFGYFAYKNRVPGKNKLFYFYIFISLIPGLFSNEVYNLLFNIIGLKEVTDKINNIRMYGYTIFLAIQLWHGDVCCRLEILRY